VIVHDSYVHHHGHATFNANDVDWMAVQRENELRFRARHGVARPESSAQPLVSACLIVKDEVEMLPGCLESLVGIADEVVIYDTGSTDDSVELGRAAGARVLEGHWDDDFSRARNQALAACRGVWVLHVDADERVVVDEPDALRTTLRRNVDVDAWVVRIENLDDAGRVGTEHRAARLFRRARGQWHGRLHEQVLPRPGQSDLVRMPSDDLVVRHLGYTSAIVSERDKGARNLRLAAADLDEAPYGDRPLLLLNLARSLVGAGQLDEALDRCVEVRDHTGPTIARPGALRVGAEVLCNLGRAEEALEWIDALRAISSTPHLCNFLEGSARLQLGDTKRAAELLADVGEVWDDMGLGGAPDQIRARKARAMLADERWDAAAEELLAFAHDRPGDAIWGHLAVSHHRAGLPLAPVAELVRNEAPNLRAVLAQVLASDAEAADAFGEALWALMPGDPRLVAFAVHLGPKLPVGRAMEWAARARHAGLDDRCPLLVLAADPATPGLERVRAAAVVAVAFDDDRAVDALRVASASLDPSAMEDALLELDQLAPDLLPAFVLAAASDPARTAAVADALAALGASEQAELIREKSASQRSGLAGAGRTPI
jgi:hypothetical protein